MSQISKPVVMKFGGGCLKSEDAFLRVTEILRESYPVPPVVVVSAINGVTDILESAINSALDSDEKIEPILEGIRNLHLTILMKTVTDFQVRQKVLTGLDARLEKMKRLLYGIAYTGEVTETIHVLVLSYGERLASLLLTGVLISNGLKAKSLDADKIGLVTDSVCSNAAVDFSMATENIKQHLLPLLQQGTIPIITGFIGCASDGKTTSFGRNGSDYSAAAIARILDVEEIHIWKDVDGFMTADPEVINSAKTVETLSYLEAAELSYFGARVFHPRTVEPLISTAIKIFVKNLDQPDSVTVVQENGHTKRDVIKSVTFNKSVAVLRIHGAGVGYKPGIIGDIGRRLSDAKINIFSVITAQTCINLLLAKEDLRRAETTLKDLTGGVIERIQPRDDFALIAVVGEGLLTTKGLAAKVFSAVANAGINVEMFSAGASEVAYYFIVDNDAVEKAVKAVHRQFFGRG